MTWLGVGALVLRALYLVELWHTPFFSILVGDGKQYAAWAQEIAGGQWLGTSVFYQAPLYPYLLALLYKVAGPDPGYVRVVQIVLGSASCLLLAQAGRRFVGDRARSGRRLDAGAVPARHLLRRPGPEVVARSLSGYGAAGAARGVHRAAGAALAASVAAFYVLGRCRFPIVPVAMIFAGVGVVGLIDAVRGARRRGARALAGLWPGFALAALAAVVSNVPLLALGDDTRLNVGEEVMQAGRASEAAAHYQAALRAKPDYVEAMANLSLSLAASGDCRARIGRRSPWAARRPSFWRWRCRCRRASPSA